MIIQNLSQGTPEWHEYRAKHFNASEAPAMLGVSPYKTRNDLLKQMATGIAPEVDEFTQSLFDDGHRFEDLSRQHAEKIIGSDLYPVTGSEGRLSASFDGLTMNRKIVWEHKTLNNEIRQATCAAELGIHLRVQMEQQLMLANAEKCLFMATKWNKDTGVLLEEVHHWYESDPELRTRLIQGWTQFAVDLENYAPVHIDEKPEAKAVIELPALFLQAEGKVVSSNLEAFGKALQEHLKETRELVYLTDQDFADAESRAKLYRETCKKIDLAEDAMLAQTGGIDEARRLLSLWREDLRVTALQIEKDCKKNKESKQLSIISDAKTAFASFIAELQSSIAPITLQHTTPNFADAIKGKRLFSAMTDAVQTMLANAKIEYNQVATAIAANLNWFKAHDEYRFLFNDLQTIVYKKSDDFQLLVTSRISEHKKREAEKLEAQREQLRIEAEAKAKADIQREQALINEKAAEAERKAAADLKAAQDKLNAEAEAQRIAAAKLAADQLAFEQAKQEAPALPVQPIKVATAEIVNIAESKNEAPTLTLGKIGARLGFALTADFLRGLGFEPAARERGATLYRESDWTNICSTLIDHIEGARNQQQAA